MRLQSKERSYINREFKFFFHAILHVDPFAQPNGISKLESPWKVKTVTKLYTPAALTPFIDGILEYYFIEADKDSTIRLGILTSPPGVRDVRLEGWKIEQGP